MENKLPTLYKLNSKGKIQYWEIGVVKSTKMGFFDIKVNYGQQNGKIQTSFDTITEGKNIGKANETSILQQAQFEATAKWTKQQERKGYKTDVTKLNIDERPGAEPMLAHRYDKYPDKIKFPCFIQPKFDGHRCLAIITLEGCTLFSRQRKEITSLPHINTFLFGYVSSSLPDSAFPITLDGELYNHDYKDNFEDLTGFIRSKTPKIGHEVVQLHVYDIIIGHSGFEIRSEILKKLFENLPDSSPLREVLTKKVEQKDVVQQFKEFLSLGYEGAMLRNKLGGYQGKRSYDLQKVKQFVDEEFEIVDIEEGRGAMKGHAIFVCKTPNDKLFKAKMKGPLQELAKIYNNKDEYKNRIVTVQFQEYTKDGIPRFPVALRLKEDI